MKRINLFRKAFLLCALVVGSVSSAWADETIFSATVNQTGWRQTDYEKFLSTSSNWTACANSIVTGTTTTSLSSTTVSNQYYQRSPNSTDPSGYWYSITASAVVYKITFTTALAAGDIISVQLKGNNSSATDIGLCFQSTEVTTRPGTISSYQLKASLAKGAETVTYTILDADESLIGKTALYFYRYNSTGTYFDNLTITRPVSHSVTVNVNNESYGSASTALTVLGEGKTTTITAVPNTGYKVINWTVSGTGATISPSGDSNSLTTTLTMGTADATVTCTFGTATTYTISYNPGSYGSGTISDGTKTEKIDYILSSETFTRDGYMQKGWNTSADGTGTHYDLGGTYTTDDDLTLYPEWIAINYSWSPSTTSGTVEVGNEVTTSVGGEMKVDVATITYASTSGKPNIEFATSAAVSVTLFKNMQAGTVITATLFQTTSSDRILYLKNSSGETVDTWKFDGDGTNDFVFSYTVTSNDGLAGNNVFKLVRGSNVRLRALTVANCANEVSGTITPAGWSTFTSPYPIDLSTLTVSEGTVTAYYASAADGSTVTLTPTGNVTVPAGEGIMVKGTAGEKFTINVAASGTAISGNLLKGQTSTSTVAASTASKSHYVFGYVTETPSTYGFYNLGSDTRVEAGKAYLEITTGSGSARALRITFGDITGVENVEAVTEASAKKNGAYLENGKIAIYKNGMKFNVNGQLIK